VRFPFPGVVNVSMVRSNNPPSDDSLKIVNDVVCLLSAAELQRVLNDIFVTCGVPTSQEELFPVPSLNYCE